MRSPDVRISGIKGSEMVPVGWCLHTDLSSLLNNTDMPDGKKIDLAYADLNLPPTLWNLRGTNDQMPQTTIEKIRRGNLATVVGVSFTADFIEAGQPGANERGTDFYTPKNFKQTFARHNGVYVDLFERRRDVLVKVTNQRELRKAQEQGKIAMLRANECCEGADDNDFADMNGEGIWIYGLKWNDHNPNSPLELGTPSRLAGGGGATERGIYVARSLSEAGKVIDVAHSNDDTAIAFINAAAKGKVPAIASHSFLKPVAYEDDMVGVEHARNISWAVLEALHDNGGLIGIPGSERFNGGATQVMKFLRMMKAKGWLHMVGFGTDFGGMSKVSYSSFFGDASTITTNLDLEMQKAGFDEQERYNVSYGNAHRFTQTYLAA